MSRQGATPEQRARYKTALSEALKAGYAVLEDGGEAMDAAVAAVASMEGEYTRRFEPAGLADDMLAQIVRFSTQAEDRYSMLLAR